MISKRHLRACQQHGVVDNEGECPVCETDAEARPEGFTGNVTQLDLRWQIEPDTTIELLEALLSDAPASASVFVAVAELPEDDLAAGYTRQERWFNVVGYEIDGQTEFITQNSEARETIDKIHAGESVVEAEEYGFDRLDPEEWEGVVAPYCENAEFERLSEDRLRMTLDCASEEIYKMAREQIGELTDAFGLKVYTREKGNRFQNGIVEVSHRD